jgi:hypothetical protein
MAGNARKTKSLNQIIDKIEDLLDEYGDEPFPSGSGPMDDTFDSSNPFSSLFEMLSAGSDPEIPVELATCPVTFTKSQREHLLTIDTVSGDIHKMISSKASGEQTFRFNPRQMLVLLLAIMEALEQCPSEREANPLTKILENLFEGVSAIISNLESLRSATLSLVQPTQTAYQIKITLEHSKPPIWRRVQVPDCTLDVLHEIIQTAMGWYDCHLHMFQIGDVDFGEAGPDGLDDVEDESKVLLSQVVEDGGFDSFRYTYDFGDDWRHKIKIEKTLDPAPKIKLPHCIKGARACPPEDVGGVWGYEEFLEAISDPRHERHEEFKEWCEGPFDPDQFTPSDVNQRFRRG